MSIVETSAQCRSSRKSTSGRDRERSWKSAPSSRFIRSCDAAARRRAGRPSTTRSIDRVATCTYHVGATVFISVCSDSPRRAVQQAVERLEDRQVRLGAGQPFGAAAAGDDRPLGPRRQLGEEVLDQARLADARLAGDAEDQALAVPHPRVGAAQLRRARPRGRPSFARRAADGRAGSVSVSPALQARAAPRPPRAPMAGARAPSRASGARARRAPAASPG